MGKWAYNLGRYNDGAIYMPGIRELGIQGAIEQLSLEVIDLLSYAEQGLSAVLSAARRSRRAESKYAVGRRQRAQFRAQYEMKLRYVCGAAHCTVPLFDLVPKLR